MNEPTIEEWFANLCVARARAKTALSDQYADKYDEYADRYESAIEDIEHSLRRGCNLLNRIARDKEKRNELNKHERSEG